MKKYLLCLLVLGLLFGLVIGCGQDDVADDPTDDPEDVYRIGVLLPLSGGFAYLGQETLRGYELTQKEWNEKGGINGRQIEFVVADAPTGPDATSEAERLITREQVPVIIGTYSSVLSTSAVTVAERYAGQVLYFESGAVSDAIPTEDREWLIHFPPRGSQFGTMAIGLIEEYLPEAIGKDISEIRVAVVHEDGPYGTSVATAAAEAAGESPLDFIGVEPHADDATDLTSLVARLAAEEPDAVVMVQNLTSGLTFWQNMKDADLYVPMLVGCGSVHSTSDFTDAVGDEVIGLFNLDYVQYGANREYTPGMDEFLDSYRSEYNREPVSAHSLMSYIATQALFTGIANAEDPDDPASILAGLKQVDIPEFGTAGGIGVRWDHPTKPLNTRAWPAAHQWHKIDGEYVQLPVFPVELSPLDEILLPLPPWDER